MKHLRYLLMAALVALPLTACDEDDDPVVEITPFGTVTGTVSVDGTGFAGIGVTLVGQVSQSATTGAGGTYTFTNVPAGSYGVSIDASAQPDVSFAVTAKTTTITTDGETVSVDFTGQYIRTASIYGVVSASGAPIDATVTITGGPESISESTGTAGGSYAFSGLRAGAYTVAVSDLPAGVSFATDSHDVTVTTGESKVVHFNGEAVEMAAISGAVTIDGVAAVGVVMTLSGGADATTETGANGAYSFVNLTPGTYTVTVTPPDAETTFDPMFKTVQSLNAGETAVLSFAGTGPFEPATVSIKSITRSFLFDEIPVDLDNVFDQIEITLNITRNDDVLKYVDIIFTRADTTVVMATQVFAPPAAGAELAGAAEETQLSIQTTQLKPGTTQTFKGDVVWVPAAHNGAWEVGAVLVVDREGGIVPSDKKPIVLQNEDVILAGTAYGGDLEFFADDKDVEGAKVAGEWDGEDWFSGDATARGWQWVSYSTIKPTNIEFDLMYDQDGYSIWPDEVIIDGDPISGIVITNKYDMSDVENDDIEVDWWDGDEIDYPENAVGPDGTGVWYNDDYIAAIGAMYYLSDPDDQVGPRRYIIDPDDVQEGQITDPGDLNFDNVAPTVFIDNVAFRDGFSEDWVNGSYDFVANDVTHTENGVGWVTEKAFLWTPGSPGTCTATQVTTPDADAEGDEGTFLAATLTSDGTPEGYWICGYAVDGLMNDATTGGSNPFGVDRVAPTLRFHADDAALALTGVHPFDPAALTTLSTDLNENIFGTANMTDVSTFHFDELPDPDMTWGLEAIDDRAGLENLAVNNETYPFQQSLSYINGSGTWNSCSEPYMMHATALSDNFRRTSSELGFMCGQNPLTAMGIWTYTGSVTDRAGNVTKTPKDSYNWLVDAAAGGEIGSVRLEAIQYGVGESGSFRVYGSDDLEIIKGQLGLVYPTNTALGDVTLLYPPVTFADRWDTSFFEEFGPDVMTVDKIYGRIDFTDDAGLLLGSYQTGLDALPTSVSANIPEDAGFNPPENADETDDFESYALNGWTDDSPTPAPWSTTNITSWTFDDGTMKAVHKVSTSVDPWYFDKIWLVELNGTTLQKCGALELDGETDFVETDNGDFRFYTYTFPTAWADACPGTGSLHAVGLDVDGLSMLVTPGPAVVVPPTD